MSCADIAAKLGRMPKFAHNVGEVRKTPKGDLLTGVYRETYCSFEIGKGEISAIESDIQNLTASLMTIQSQIRSITATGGQLEYFIGCFIEGNSGMIFDAQLLYDLAALKISLGFDLYGDYDGQ